MDKESTTFGLSPETLARILKIGSDASRAEDEVSEERKKAELLADWLEATLPLDAALVGSLPKVLRRLCQELGPLASEPFGKLLQDPNTDLRAIRRIKGYSKKLVSRARSDAEHDAAVAIYYAAIANALLFHNRRITKFSYVGLKESFSAIVEQNWLTADLKRLFNDACEFCDGKARRGGQKTTL
jgi:hypothetical protein